MYFKNPVDRKRRPYKGVPGQEASTVWAPNPPFTSPPVFDFGLASTTFYHGIPSYTSITGTSVGDVITWTALPAGFTVDADNFRVNWDGSAPAGTEDLTLTLTKVPMNEAPETQPIQLTILNPSVQPAPASFMGVNMGGMEQYVAGSSAGWQTPAATSYTAAAGRGLAFIRETARWERFQPNGLNTTIDPTYTAALKAACANAYAAGQKWILDIHNYGRYNNGVVSGVIGDGTVTIDAFVNLISQVAAAFKGTPGYYGFDFMNEPHDMPSLDINAQMMQAAINAVRDPNGANDQDVVCYIECNNYSSAWSFDLVNPGIETLTDPANRFLIMVHMYPDMDDSGTGIDLNDTTYHHPYEPYHLQILGGQIGPSAPPGLPVGPNIGVERLSNAFNKILACGFPVVDGFTFCLGEHGVPCDTQYIGKYLYFAPYGDGTDADDAAWRVEADNTFTWCKAHGAQVLLWQVGPQLGTDYSGVDFQCLEPDDSGLQRIQMAIVTKHTGAPEPTVFRFDAPSYGDVGQASSPLRITYRGNIASASVFTPSDNGAGGTFTPSSLTMEPGVNYVGTFTYTPATAGRITLTVSNSAGLTPIISPKAVGGASPQIPGSLIMSAIPASDDVVRSIVESGRAPSTLLSRTHLLNAAWLGPIIQLVRNSDGATKDFYPASLTDNRVDREEIATWAGTTSDTNSNLKVAIVYDQSGSGGHEYAYSAGYRAPYVLDGGNGYPVEQKGTGNKSSFACDPEGNDQSVVFDAYVAKASYVLTFCANIGHSIGIITGPTYRVHTGTYPTDGAENPSYDGNYIPVSSGMMFDTFHTYSYRFQHDTTSGIQSYCDGALVAEADTTGGVLTWQRYTADVGWFRFGDSSSTRANITVRNIIISRYAYTDAEMAALSTLCTAPYQTAWPAIAETVYPPQINATANANWTVATGKPVSPFFSCTDVASSPFTHTISSPLSVTNPDVSMNVTATLLMSANNGTLSAPGATQDANNPLLYHYASQTPAALTKLLVGSTSPWGVGGAYNLYPGVVFTPSASGQTTTFTLTVTNDGGASATYNATTVQSVDVAPIETPFAAPSGQWTPIGNLKGANMSAGTSHDGDATIDSRNYPTGTYNYAYGYGASFEYAYLAEKGFGIARLAFSFRRLMPHAFGLLDTNETARLKSLLDDAYARGQTIILDAHDYGGIYDSNAAGGTLQQLVNASPYAQSLFIDGWKRIASLFKNYPNVAFDLMNEPNPGAADWCGIVRNTISAIRGVGANQLILIEGGTHSSDANNWASIQGTLWDDFNQPGWTGVNGDPANNFAFSPHRYLDGGGGTSSTVVAGSGNTVLISATNWATTQNDGTTRAVPFKLFLGEFGWNGNDNQSSGGVPSVEGYDLCAYMNAHPAWIGGTYFIMGPKNFSGPIVTSAIPTYDSSGNATADPPQMAVLLRWLNDD